MTLKRSIQELRGPRLVPTALYAHHINQIKNPTLHSILRSSVCCSTEPSSVCASDPLSHDACSVQDSSVFRCFKQACSPLGQIWLSMGHHLHKCFRSSQPTTIA